MRSLADGNKTGVEKAEETERPQKIFNESWGSRGGRLALQGFG